MHDLVMSSEDPLGTNFRALVTRETFNGYRAIRQRHGPELPWHCPFVLPPWVETWWDVWGGDAEPLILGVREGETLLGVAPLMIQKGVVRFLGDPGVCDYFDCIVRPGREKLFFETLLAHLAAEGFKGVHLGPLRPDSSVQNFFSRNEPSGEVDWALVPGDAFSELELPDSWEGFLAVLNGKQRHELRRKFRRLEEAGSIGFRRVHEPVDVPSAMEAFQLLFTLNRPDKAAFMSGRMATFFQMLAAALAKEGLLSLFFLEIEERPVASVFCVDHQGTRYLYNNGYDNAWQRFSVGLMSKVMSLKNAIDGGFVKYNFLKGGETYKARLGGKSIPLWNCHLTLP